MAIQNVVTPTNLGVEFDIGVATPNKITVKVDGTTITKSPTGVLSAVPCAPPPVTVAAAKALRGTGVLKAGCVVTVTDWVRAPNLSGPNLVQMQVLDDLSYSQEVNVLTPYDNTAWVGQFDIDADANGRMIELKDRLGNTARDETSSTNTIGAFPWGNTQWTENFFDSVTLTLGAALTAPVSKNVARDSILDWSLWGGFGYVLQSEFISCTLSPGTGLFQIEQARIVQQAVVDPRGSGAFLIRNSTIATAGTRITSDALSVGAISIISSTIDTGYVVRLGPLNSTANGVNIASSRCHGNVVVPNGSCFNNGTSSIGITMSYVVQSSVQNQGGAQITLNQANVTACTISRNPASVAKPLVIGTVSMRGTTVAMAGNTAGGQFVFTRGVYDNCNFTDNGNGSITIANVIASELALTTAAGVVRGLAVNGGRFSGGDIIQNSTATLPAGPLVLDQLIGCRMTGQGVAKIIFNVAAAAAPTVAIRAVDVTDSTLNVGDANGAAIGPVVTGAELRGGSVLNWTGPGKALNTRMLASTVTTAGFQFENTIVETGFTKTLTGANLNRLANVAFDNVV